MLTEQTALALYSKQIIRPFLQTLGQRTAKFNSKLIYTGVIIFILLKNQTKALLN